MGAVPRARNFALEGDPGRPDVARLAVRGRREPRLRARRPPGQASTGVLSYGRGRLADTLARLTHGADSRGTRSKSATPRGAGRGVRSGPRSWRAQQRAAASSSWTRSEAYLGAGVDMHRANETRPILTGRRRLATERRCDVLARRPPAQRAADRPIRRRASARSTSRPRSVRILQVGDGSRSLGTRVLAERRAAGAEASCSLACTSRERSSRGRARRPSGRRTSCAASTAPLTATPGAAEDGAATCWRRGPSTCGPRAQGARRALEADGARARERSGARPRKRAWSAGREWFSPRRSECARTRSERQRVRTQESALQVAVGSEHFVGRSMSAVTRSSATSAAGRASREGDSSAGRRGSRDARRCGGPRPVSRPSALELAGASRCASSWGVSRRPENGRGSSRS